MLKEPTDTIYIISVPQLCILYTDRGFWFSVRRSPILYEEMICAAERRRDGGCNEKGFYCSVESAHVSASSSGESSPVIFWARSCAIRYSLLNSDITF